MAVFMSTFSTIPDEKALPGPEEQAEADAKELVTSEPKKEEGILAKVKSFFKFGKE